MLFKCSNWVNWFNWTKSITQLDTINCTNCTIKLNCLHSSNSQRSRHKQTAQIAKPILIGPSGSHGQSSLNIYIWYPLIREHNLSLVWICLVQARPLKPAEAIRLRSPFIIKATKTRFLHCKPLDSVEPFADPKEYWMAFMADREINRHQLFHH